MYEVAIDKDDVVVFTPNILSETDLSIAPIPIKKSDRNLFGLSEKTRRLPGHACYFNEK